MNKNLVYAIIVIIIAFAGILMISNTSIKRSGSITSYQECVGAGYPVLESYPEQCKTPDGQTFTRIISNIPTNNDTIGDLIVVESVKTNSTVASPLMITGRARGTFYFEASFPVKILDASGNILAEAPSQAQSDWMTNEFVPFKVTLNFNAPSVGGSGLLVFHNDNPSGLPENDRELRIPIKFAPTISNNKEFNSPFSLKIGDRASFSDTLVVTLKTIEDSRCKAGVQCIWAGELAPVLIVGKAQSIVRLGTVTKQSVTFGNYTFNLNSATETTANITVRKNNLASTACYIGGCSSQICSDQKDMVSTCEYREEYACYKTAKCERQVSGKCGWTETTTLLLCINSSTRVAAGYLTGHVTIGPFCPVEREGEPCKTPESAYTSREAIVYAENAATVIDRVNLDKNGNYNLTLGPGKYYVQIDPAGIGPGEKKYAVIKSFETTTINFDIDTGIR